MQIKGKQSKEERAWSREGDESALRLGGWGLSCEKRNVRRPNRLNLKCAKLRRRRTGEAAQAMGGCGQCVDPCAGDEYDECGFVVGTKM